MQLPHRLVVITPLEVVDEYDNPVPGLDYGPAAPRRVIWGQLQPVESVEEPVPGRQPVISRWRLFTYSPLHARERIEWAGRALQVSGEPADWSPRFGRRHVEALLTEVQG